MYRPIGRINSNWTTMMTTTAMIAVRSTLYHRFFAPILTDFAAAGQGCP
jgi:hypothetical protein